MALIQKCDEFFSYWIVMLSCVPKLFKTRYNILFSKLYSNRVQFELHPLDSFVIESAQTDLYIEHACIDPVEISYFSSLIITIITSR